MSLGPVLGYITHYNQDCVCQDIHISQPDVSNQNHTGDTKLLVLDPVCPGGRVALCPHTKRTVSGHPCGAHHVQPRGTHTVASSFN